MDASSRNLLGLISEINTRFVVPVYQRPYSWGQHECLQLWNDILECGRSQESYHFTGSIVTIQDGSVSPDGVATLLLIDGQQRITTYMLILMSLARYQLRHPQRHVSFCCDEIVKSGFLTNYYRSGDEHYKLTLSKGDQNTYKALVRSLEGKSLCFNIPSETVSQRLVDNLDLFEHLIESLPDPDSVWVGMRRLEVVSIALTQGRDRPQLIFESMNSTGKDLSTSDLVRNYVLMDYRIDAQAEAYRMYWAPIEKILGELGTDSFDRAFDDYLRTYLTAVCAPQSFANVDLYDAFKRYIVAQRYNENNRMRNFVLKFKSFAEYYMALCRGTKKHDDLSLALERIHALGVPAVRPLILCLLDMQDRHALSQQQVVDIIGTLEAYLVRRSACDCSRSGLGRFFSSLIARLDAVFDRDGDYAQAFYALMRNEDNGSYAFPSDEEFAKSLCRRDAFHWSDAAYVLKRIEQQARASCGLSCTIGDLQGVTVEHIVSPADMTAAARNTTALHDDTQKLVNTLGNLALSWQQFDLQTNAFEVKKDRLLTPSDQGGSLVSNERLARQTTWGARQIEGRCDDLVDQALGLWPLPQADAKVQQEYRPRHRKPSGQASFLDLFEAGLVRSGDVLVSANPAYPGTATVEFDGSLLLSTGEREADPQQAYLDLLAHAGMEEPQGNGWLGWRRGEGGPLLDELRDTLD